MNNWIPKNSVVRFTMAATLFCVTLYFTGFFIAANQLKKVEDFYRGTESESFKEEQFWAIKSVGETNKESIQALRDFFIQKGDEVRFIDKIEEVAKSSSVKFEISSIDVGINQKDSFKEDVDVKIDMEGSWENMIRFIDKLQKMPFGVSIDKVNLDAKDHGNWSGFVEVIIFREK